MVLVESYRRAFSEALLDVGSRNRDLVVLDADTARSTGTLAFAKKYPERFINIGISEQDLVDTAAGLAIAGKTPVAAAFSMFMLRAFEQIRNTVARDSLNVKLVGTHSGLSAVIDGASHQSLEDLAVYRAIPNMTVVSPADAIATRILVSRAIEEHRGPLYMRLGRDNAFRVYDDSEDFRIGGFRVIRDGSDVMILSIGPMVWVSLQASEILMAKGIDAGVVDVYTLKPLDRRGIVKVVSRTGLVVTVEEHNIIGGLGSAIAEVLAEEKPSKMLRIGVNDSFGSSARSYDELLEFFGLTPKAVAKRILEVV
ncbi:MAG: transketolase family protein [Desulfurococcales archaeon]|nr:transketolase family protein [Desulfurococcales archaeon]